MVPHPPDNPPTVISWALPTTDEAVRLIEGARDPADLLGTDGDRAYRKLARATHPDTHDDPRVVAAFAKLAHLRDQFKHPSPVIRGDLANLYPEGEGCLLKLARHPRDNDLIAREATTLRRLDAADDKTGRAFVPDLIRTVRQKDPATGAVRAGNVLGRISGFYSLAQVRAAYPDGVDPKDAAWMWRRLLAALGWAHHAGVIHGAILPEHVMIHPGMHGLVLVDWCYSVTGGTGHVPAVVGRYRDWYPPEILAKETPGPPADIWMAAKLMQWLIGPREVAGLRMFAAGCLLDKPHYRPQDAWGLLEELDALLERMWGPRRFRPFEMPPEGSSS